MEKLKPAFGWFVFSNGNLYYNKELILKINLG
jgi:hypothetical protein